MNALLRWSFPVVAAALMSGSCLTAADPPESPSATPAGLKSFSQVYTEAFNKHDAAALSQLWAENCVHIDHATGDRTEGRAAVQKDLEETFQATPELRIVLEPGSLRMIQPNVAQVQGTATSLQPGEDPEVVSYSAILVRKGDVWLLDSVEEMAAPQPETARDALKVLQFLVGDWVDEDDEGDEGATTSSFHWAAEGSFLVRSFKTDLSEEIQSEGTQVIGWDPRSKSIRSWTFNSDGSFGEGTWSSNGSDWLVKSSQTLADGGAASGTYLVTPVDANSLTVQLLGHEINGEPVPTVPPVTMIRVTTAQASDAEAPSTSATADTPKGDDP